MTPADRGGSSSPVVPSKLLWWILLSSAQLTCLFLNPSAELRLGFLQVQSQPLELEGGFSFMWTTQVQTRKGQFSKWKLRCYFPKKSAGEAWQGRTQDFSIHSPSGSPHGFPGVHKWHSLWHSMESVKAWRMNPRARSLIPLWPLARYQQKTPAMHKRKCLLCWGGGGEGERVEKIQPFLCNVSEANPRVREITHMDLRRSIYLEPLMRIPVAISLIPGSVMFWSKFCSDFKTAQEESGWPQKQCWIKM